HTQRRHTPTRKHTHTSMWMSPGVCEGCQGYQGVLCGGVRSVQGILGQTERPVDRVELHLIFALTPPPCGHTHTHTHTHTQTLTHTYIHTHTHIHTYTERKKCRHCMNIIKN